MSDNNGNGNATTALATVQPSLPAVPIVNGTMKPDSLEGLWRLAGVIYQSRLIPKGCQSKEQVFVAVAAGLEIGLTPMQSVQNIMVVHGTPTIWGDAGLGLVLASGLCEDFKEGFEFDQKGSLVAAWCRAKRKDIASPSEWRFTVEDAKSAGLLGNNTYQKYPKRMFQMRARGFCLRNLFADVLKGLRFVEEMDDPEPSVAATITARISAPAPLPEAAPIDAESVAVPQDASAAATVNDDPSGEESATVDDTPMLTQRGTGELPGLDMSKTKDRVKR